MARLYPPLALLVALLAFVCLSLAASKPAGHSLCLSHSPLVSNPHPPQHPRPSASAPALATAPLSPSTPPPPPHTPRSSSSPALPKSPAMTATASSAWATRSARPRRKTTSRPRASSATRQRTRSLSSSSLLPPSACWPMLPSALGSTNGGNKAVHIFPSLPKLIAELVQRQSNALQLSCAYVDPIYPTNPFTVFQACRQTP